MQLSAVLPCGWSRTDGYPQLFAVLVDQALLVAVSVGLAALIRAFTGFGFAMLVVPAFSFFSRQPMLWSSARYWPSCWVCCLIAPGGFVPGRAGQTHGRGECHRYGDRGLVSGSLSVAEFQLWIGVSVVIASVVLARFVPSERAASSPQRWQLVWLRV